MGDTEAEGLLSFDDRLDEDCYCSLYCEPKRKSPSKETLPSSFQAYVFKIQR
jgi:hypothetical protein